MKAPENQAWGILVAGISVGLIPLLTYTLSHSHELHPQHGFLIGYGLASVPFIYIWRRATDYKDIRNGLLYLVVAAVITRCVLLTVPPVLSEDIWRYIWDGLVQWGGHSPYEFSPSDAHLDSFSKLNELEILRSRIGHADVATIYLPTGQATFALATLFGPSLLTMRMVMVAADIITICTLWAWLKHRNVNPGITVIFAFLPLSVIESSVGGHIDSVGVAFLVLGLYLCERTRISLGAGSIVLSIGTKLIPIVLIAHYFRRNRKTVWWLVGISAALGLGSTIIYQGYPKGLVTFAHQWRANDSFFAVAHSGILHLFDNSQSMVEVPSWLEVSVRFLMGSHNVENSGFVEANALSLAVAKSIAGLVLGLVTLRACFRAQSASGFWIVFMGCLLLVAPVIHPWYLLWILPFIVLHLQASHNPALTAFIIWSLLAWLAYWPRPDYLMTGIWNENLSLKLIQYIPVWGFLLWGGVRALRPSARESGR